MEQIKPIGNNQELINLREQAVDISNSLVNKQKQYLEEITQIVNANDSLGKGLHKYGPIGEVFADFRVVPWGHGNLDKRGLDFTGVIKANVEHKPMTEVLHSIEKELAERMSYIKETLSNFSGTEDEAFKLIETLSREKVLEPLNTDGTPILEKLS